MELPYRNFGRDFRERFGTRVIKITVDAGFSCPNRDGTLAEGGCTFCSNASFSPASRRAPRPVREQVLEARDALRRRNPDACFLVYFQAYTNTHAPVETLREVYDQALVEGVAALAVGTRPDTVPDPVLDLLATYQPLREVWLELGLQSAREETLRRIRRGHGWEAFEDAVLRANARGLKTLAHVILGLPGETRDDMMETAERLASLPLDGLKIHHLYVARGTPLEREHAEGKVETLAPEAFVSLVVDFLERTPPRVVIQRLVSDPDPGLLVAPRWNLGKPQVLDRIVREFERRGTRQGSLYGMEEG
jgi:radical SAM protein (TIGR01212 family)